MALMSPAVAVGLAGATGAVAAAGVTGSEAGLAADVPVAFVAVAMKVYGVPLVRPVKENVGPAPVLVSPPGLLVTV